MKAVFLDETELASLGLIERERNQWVEYINGLVLDKCLVLEINDKAEYDKARASLHRVAKTRRMSISTSKRQNPQGETFLVVSLKQDQ